MLPTLHIRHTHITAGVMDLLSSSIIFITAKLIERRNFQECMASSTWSLRLALGNGLKGE